MMRTESLFSGKGGDSKNHDHYETRFDKRAVWCGQIDVLGYPGKNGEMLRWWKP